MYPGKLWASGECHSPCRGLFKRVGGVIHLYPGSEEIRPLKFGVLVVGFLVAARFAHEPGETPVRIIAHGFNGWGTKDGSRHFASGVRSQPGVKWHLGNHAGRRDQEPKITKACASRDVRWGDSHFLVGTPACFAFVTARKNVRWQSRACGVVVVAGAGGPGICGPSSPTKLPRSRPDAACSSYWAGASSGAGRRCRSLKRCRICSNAR